jgi:trimeric autotransporter adhesin
MVMRILLACVVLLGACKFNEKDFGDRSCSSDLECRPDESCAADQCTQRECSVSSDCGITGKFECNAGACVAQSCSASSECGEGFACGDAFCRPSFNVLAAESISNTKIAVTFDAAPDATSAASLGNYSISGLTLSGTPAVAGSTVTLTTSSQTGGSYTVMVSGVTRASDKAPLISGNATFTGRTAFNVTTASATTSRTVLLTFDAMPDPTEAATLANYSIAGLSLSGTPLVVGNTVTLLTSAQGASSYTVTVTGVRRAGDSEALADNTADFSGRNDFNVLSAAAVDSHTITLTFDAAADAAKATTLGNYSVVNASNVPLTLSGSPVLSQDGTSVTINTASQAAGTYTITVNNVTRASDNEPLNVKTANFTGRIPFNVFSAASTSSTTVTVTFDATPTTAQATDLANYDIPGLTINTATLLGNTVTLTTSAQSATSYMVTVSNVTRTSDGEPLTIATANFTGRSQFNVSGATSLSSQTVRVTFDAAPNASQATMASNYSIPGLTVLTATLSGNQVTLTTTSQSVTQFTVTVSGVTRASDGEALTLAIATFTGRSPFNVVSAASVTSKSITLTFDAPPNAAEAQTLGNYSANNGLTFSTVSYPGTGNTVTLTTSTQTATAYQVTVSNVHRASDGEGLTINNASFTGRSSFNVATASSTGNTTMTVTFDAAPNMTQATNLANYTITAGSLSLSGTPVVNGNVVTITTSTQTGGASYTVTVSNVTRASDGEALTTAAATFSGKSGFNVASASSVSRTSMSVTFDAAPNSATATNINNYAVPGLTLSGPVVLSGNTVTMTTTAQAGQTYTVTVSNVLRAADSATLTVNSASFTHVTFNVVSAAAISSGSITVTFDALPNSTQATTLANYSIKDQMNNTLAVTGTPVLNSTTNTVTIGTAPQTGGKNYTVTVNNVTRASDATPLTVKTAQFVGIAPFDVTAAASPTSASMTVTFSHAPNATQATTLANYVVPGLTLSGTPILSGNTVTIQTSVQMAISYTVTVSNVTRASDAEPLTINSRTWTGKAQSLPTVTNVVVTATLPNNGTTFYNTGTATMTITGSQFTGVVCPAGVTLDDRNGLDVLVKTPAVSCTVDSDTQITATFPAGIRTNGLTGWGVIVTNTAGPSATSTVKVIVKAGLLVSEVYAATGGGGGAVHEYIEVYNPTATAIDISTGGAGLGLAVHVRDGSGADTNLPLTFVNGGSHKSVPSHGFWLLTSTESSADTWYALRDATYGAAAVSANGALQTNGSVYISLSGTAQIKVIDKFGWKAQPAGGFEGTVYPDVTADKAAERKPGVGAGNATDTDSNNGDFRALTTTLAPKGTASAIE